MDFNLRNDYIDAKPIDYDFSEGYTEDSGWDIVYPSTDDMSREECERILGDLGVELDQDDFLESLRDQVRDGQDGPDDLDEWDLERLTAYLQDIDDEDYVNRLREQIDEHFHESEDLHPMMNYAYPIGDLATPEAILDLPLTLVEIGGSRYLALTGGGMDLSWEICLGYIQCGYLPPVHFLRLPRYAGMSMENESTRKVIEAGQRSVEIQMNWLRNISEDLARIAEGK